LHLRLELFDHWPIVSRRSISTQPSRQVMAKCYRNGRSQRMNRGDNPEGSARTRFLNDIDVTEY
jgi:hypothetical protein